jgi:hypothetical protein
MLYLAAKADCLLWRPAWLGVYFLSMLIPVEVASFALDAGNNSPVLLLRESAGGRMLEIPIGPFEASAIALQWFNLSWEKPQTIDLCGTLIAELGASVDKVVLFRGPNASASARLCLMQGGQARTVECRPGDAVSVAIRCCRPILAEESMFARSARAEPRLERDELRAAISNTDTVEFGRYYLE